MRWILDDGQMIWKARSDARKRANEQQQAKKETEDQLHGRMFSKRQRTTTTTDTETSYTGRGPRVESSDEEVESLAQQLPLRKRK
jgi:hypothetical protein